MTDCIGVLAPKATQNYKTPTGCVDGPSHTQPLLKCRLPANHPCAQNPTGLRWHRPRSFKRRMPQSKHETARRFRSNPSRAERELWDWLRCKRFQGLRFHRQKCMFGYIADFWCPKRGIIIEVDGPHHADTVDADNTRDEVFVRYGIGVIRVSAYNVLLQPEKVVDAIKAVIG